MGIKKHWVIIIIAALVAVAFFYSGMKSGMSEPKIEEDVSFETSSDDADVLDTSPAPSSVVVFETADEEDDPSAEVDLLYEAEDATFDGLELFSGDNQDDPENASGNGYVGLFEKEDSRLTFNVEAPTSGMYELVFYTASDGQESYNTIIVNSRTFYEALFTKSTAFEKSAIKAELNEGRNTIIIEKDWGGVYIDCLRIRTAEGIRRETYDVAKTLTNPNASDHARRLMSYLADQYGKATLSGQYNNNDGIDSPEIQQLYELTGKYPAIVGFDFVDYSPTRTQHGTESRQTEYALQWYEMGGIVSFMWHWNAPKDLIDSDENPWWRGFYTDATTFDLNKALSGKDTDGYALILRDIDAIAEQINILADEDVPIIWRPLHEASGGWFWWGAYGADNYKKLWRLMYERLTDTHGLNNLIWVYNGQDAAWYPGDEYVDIIAEDIYTQPYDYESHYNRFESALQYTDQNKIVGLAENGVIPDPDLMYEDNACWSFFMTWNDLFVVDSETKKISDQYNTFEHFKEVYNHNKVITLDELPQLDNYPID